MLSEKTHINNERLDRCFELDTLCVRDLDSNRMICLQVIGFSCLSLIILNLVMFSYRKVIPDNPGSLAREGFIPVRRERERDFSKLLLLQ